MAATQLHKATESGTPLRIVFVPSSHYQGQAITNDFTPRAKMMWEYMTRHSFYKRYVSRIEAWLINDTLTGDMLPNYPDMFADEAKVLNWVQSKQVTSFDPKNGDVIVFCVGHKNLGNTRGYTSDTAHVAWTNMAKNMENCFIHEFSHAFAHLGDEYAPQKTPPAKPPDHPNIATPDSPYSKGNTCKDKWGDMMGLPLHPRPGVQDLANWFYGQDQVKCEHITGTLNIGGQSTQGNWYRPVGQMQCIMYQSGDPNWPYCPVCQRHLEKLMHGYGTGETTVTFECLPDGHKVDRPWPLQGNEFLAYGVFFSPDPVHYAANLKTRPAVLPGGHGATVPYLGMVDVNNVNQPVSRNIHMTFDWPLSEVTVTFFGASSKYKLEAYGEDGVLLATEYKEAQLNQGPFQITVKDTAGRIRKVEFGEDTSITIITELRYR